MFAVSNFGNLREEERGDKERYLSSCRWLCYYGMYISSGEKFRRIRFFCFVRMEANRVPGFFRALAVNRYFFKEKLLLVHENLNIDSFFSK